MEEVLGILSVSQLFFVFVFVACIGFVLYFLVMINRGYQLIGGSAGLHSKLIGINGAIIAFGIALAFLFMTLMSSPEYVFTLTSISTKVDLFLAFFFIAFLSAMVTTTFLLFTKRGGI